MVAKVHVAGRLATSQEETRGELSTGETVDLTILHRGLREARHRLTLRINCDDDGVTVAVLAAQPGGLPQILGTYILVPEQRPQVELQYHLEPKGVR